jgi:hypothetical protein
MSIPKCPYCNSSLEISHSKIVTGQGYCPRVHYAICTNENGCPSDFFVAAEERDLLRIRVMLIIAELQQSNIDAANLELANFELSNREIQP